MGTWSIIGPMGNEVSLQGLSVDVSEAKGGGLPEQHPIGLEVVQAGASDAPLLYERSISKVRRLELVLRPRVRETNLPAVRLALIAALNPDLVSGNRPAYLRYAGASATMQLAVVYEKGLEIAGTGGGQTAGDLTITLLAHDPAWVATDDAPPVTLAVQEPLSGNYVFRRKASGDQVGVWEPVGSLNGPVYALARGDDGSLCVCGAFTGSPAYVAVWDSEATPPAWVALGSSGGPDTPALALCPAPGGLLYAGGSFSGQVKKWTGSAWETLNVGGGVVWSLATGNDGVLYAGGNGFSGGYYLLRWIGSWNAITGLNGPVFALTRGPCGIIYAGGSFTAPGTNIAAWNPSDGTWSTLGGGLPGAVHALAFLPDGTLVAAGMFSWSEGGETWGYVAEWNGVVWRSLGRVQGGSEQALALAVRHDGLLYAVGEFATADGLTLPDPQAQWNGYAWFPLDCTLPGGGNTNAVVVEDDGTLVLGCDNTGSDGSRAGVSMVHYGGTAAGYPVLTVTGPGRLYEIINRTTGDTLYFDLVLAAGEVLVIDLRPGRKSLVSNVRGNVVGHLVPGSRLASWHLVPGPNAIAVYMTNTTGASGAEMIWRERHWSRDAAG